ncbi:MAG TPA: hypothetical protein VK750_06560 [Cytophagaceae bacterium]|jgi:hypothetical protein|nr:hypothetical protein [Cytophagaceae bacterium]
MIKLRAYTVMEMIVVMLISSIIVTMSYSIYTKIFSLKQKVGDMYGHNYNMVLFNRLLTTDVLQSELIQSDDSGFSFLYKDHEVKYVFDEVLVRKQATITDTLTSLTGCTIEFNYVDTTHHVIKEIRISGQYDGEDVSMVFNKSYGADFLMKLDE